MSSTREVVDDGQEEAGVHGELVRGDGTGGWRAGRPCGSRLARIPLIVAGSSLASNVTVASIRASCRTMARSTPASRGNSKLKVEPGPPAVSTPPLRGGVGHARRGVALVVEDPRVEPVGAARRLVRAGPVVEVGEPAVQEVGLAVGPEAFVLDEQEDVPRVDGVRDLRVRRGGGGGERVVDAAPSSCSPGRRSARPPSMSRPWPGWPEVPIWSEVSLIAGPAGARQTPVALVTPADPVDADVARAALATVVAGAARQRPVVAAHVGRARGPRARIAVVAVVRRVDAAAPALAGIDRARIPVVAGARPVAALAGVGVPRSRPCRGPRRRTGARR